MAYFYLGQSKIYLALIRENEFHYADGRRIVGTGKIITRFPQHWDSVKIAGVLEAFAPALMIQGQTKDGDKIVAVAEKGDVVEIARRLVEEHGVEAAVPELKPPTRRHIPSSHFQPPKRR